MKKIKITLLIMILLINSIVITGCWNYRETDDLSIVAGMAVDKDESGLYKITVEVIETGSVKDIKTKSKLITIQGKTTFDAVRNGISVSGKKLYWGHTKVLILSKKVASEGVRMIVDWYNRDAETREDVYIFISKEDTAKEILEEPKTSEEIKSFTIHDIIVNQRNLNKAPKINILQYDNELQACGISPIIPSIDVKKSDGKTLPQVLGTAILKNDKLVGFLNGEDTKDLNFIRDEVKGGLLIQVMQEDDVPTPISLEIFKSKTKVTPIIEGKDIKINISIETTVAIDEISGAGNFFDEKGLKMLKQSVENTLQERIIFLIKKVQSEYGVDIFGFGTKVRENKPKVWKSVVNDWEEIFKHLKVDVKVNVHIKNSGVLSKDLKESEW